MGIDRTAMKKQLAARQEEQQKLKNRGIGDFESYFETPEGVSQFSTKPTEDGADYGFDIIPFIVGSKFPSKKGGLAPGSIAYVLDVFVHYNVGPTNKPVVCPLENYGEACPICEKRVDVMAEKGRMEKEEFKKFKAANKELWPTRRAMYNVIARHDEKEEKKGIQIYEISHFFSEKKYQDAARRPRGGGLVPYPDMDEGKTIWINFKKDGDNWDVGIPIFEDRKYVISDEEIEAATQLDETLVIYDYDEIVDMMSLKKSKGEDQEQEAPPEEAVKEEAPVVSRRRAPAAKEEETVTTEEGVVNTGTGEVVAQVCKFDGLTFGSDNNEFDVCDTCAMFDDCGAEKDRLEQEAKKEEAPAPVRRRKLAQ